MFEKEAEEYAGKGGLPKEKYMYGLKAMSFKDGAEFGYNKCKEEINKNGLALQSDMDKTIEQNVVLKKELEKIKWHKVADGDLPKEEKDYLVKLSDGTVNVFYVGIDGNLEPFILTTEGVDFFKDVEKWCEIPKYEE